MAVDDNWGEAIRKSAIQKTPGDKSEYLLETDSRALSSSGEDLAYNSGDTNDQTQRVVHADDVPINVKQTTHDNLNANANIQVSNSDVTNTNYVPAGQSAHDNLNANANIQVNNLDATSSNFVPIGQPTHDSLNANVNMQVKNTDIEFLAGSSTVAVPMQIIGNDGTYRAFVDADGRVSVNANVTFPEVFQFKKPVLSGTRKDLAVNGSSTNRSFSIAPPSDVKWFLQGISIAMSDNGEFSSSEFASIAALSNGLRAQVKSKNITKEIFNIKENFDVYNIFTDSDFFLSVNGGAFGADENTFSGKDSFANRIALDGAFGDNLTLTVRDNLSGVSKIYIYAHYWELNG